MTTAMGATWLDRHMAEDGGSNGRLGFGAEVETAALARREFLVQIRVLKFMSAPVTQKVMEDLKRRDLQEAGAALSAEFQKSYRAAPESGQISGRLRGSVDRPSGRFAVVEKSKEFTLVPWRAVLERRRGQTVSGFVRDGGVSWRLGKTRDRI